MKLRAVLTALIAVAPLGAQAAFMDAEWAAKACDAWNADIELTGGLGGETWAANNDGRGFKMIQIYRSECGDAAKIQLTIEDKDGKAMCTYGGVPDGKAFDKKFDYVMNATDEDWTCMGKGSFGCGAMGAMMSGKLKFTGPKMEAMSVMGPFNSFLKLTGAVGGEKAACQ